MGWERSPGIGGVFLFILGYLPYMGSLSKGPTIQKALDVSGEAHPSARDAVFLRSIAEPVLTPSARPDSRPFVLQTTFPSKELADHNQTVEEAKLQNAVVVQRFT